MALTKKTKVTIFTVVGVLLLLGVAQYINWFVYPFSAANPSFKDVEAVYAKMQIPSTWTKTGEGSNKGIAGRQCGIESDGCFSKSGTFNIEKESSEDAAKKFVESSGCVSPEYKDETYKGDIEGSKYSYHCMSGGVRVGVSVDETKREAFLLTSSR